MNVADGWAAVLDAVAQAMQPDPALHIDEWAEEHIVLKPPAAMAGPYRLAHTPMARRILQALSPHNPATRIVVRGASQMLKTQTAICAVMGWMHRAPANILALEPTDKLAKRLSTRMAAAIDACDPVRDIVARPRSRDARNTIDCKEFTGGALYITTAGSAANLAEIPARYIFCDEVDRMDDNVNGEGDPIELAEARTTTFSGRQKVYIVSSPTIQDASKIDVQFDRGTQEHYHVPCPHCDELHELVLENFKHRRDDAGNVVHAWFDCPHCGAEIDEAQKPDMLRDAALGGTARWVATAAGDGETLSFQVTAFYAPPGSVTWLGLARQYVRAVEQLEQFSNLEPMRVFHNTRLAQSYAYQSNTPKADDLRTRALAYSELTVPEGGLLLVAGVDVQHDRLAVVIRAFGRGEESWLVYWGEIHGATSNSEAGAWLDLDALLLQDIPTAYGSTLRVRAVSIDGSDGNRTDVVHAHVRRRQQRGYMAIKGAAEQTSDRREIYAPPRPVDPGKRRTISRHGLHTHIVGTNRAKDLILESRVHLQGTGPGRMHAYASVRGDYWDQLTSEIKAPHGPKKRPVWLRKGGTRNEALDCEVYALHAARSVKTNLMREAHWQALEQRLRQRSLLDPVITDAAVIKEPTLADDTPPPEAPISAAVQTPVPQPAAALARPNTPPPAAATPATTSKKSRRGSTKRGAGFAINSW